MSELEPGLSGTTRKGAPLKETHFVASLGTGRQQWPASDANSHLSSHQLRAQHLTPNSTAVQWAPCSTPPECAP
eukprot:scaffold238916_cov18-Tisochrysis_lutea.AAC.1